MAEPRTQGGPPPIEGASPDLGEGVQPAPPRPSSAAEGGAGEPSIVAQGETIAPTLTTRQVLELALEWASEGLHHYGQGDREVARQNLGHARRLLGEGELPDSMREQGLAVLNCCLPREFAHYDLEAVVRELETDELTERQYIEAEVRRILKRFGDVSPSEAYLAVFVEEVERYVALNKGREREFFERAYRRKHKYQPTISAIFTRHKIPVELSYMALVESGMSPRAHSRAGARGLWQFIPSTGRAYGLQRSTDFYDVAKATEAAAQYLLDLIAIFGSRSFLLATAAYNAGEERIMGCLRKLEDPFEGRSFWAIRGCLARETRAYVPRIMAAAVIGSDPRRFGFDLETQEEMLRRYEVAVIPQVTRLSHIAQLAGVSVADLKSVNTDIAKHATSTPGRNFPLYVPKGKAQDVTAGVAAASTGSKPAPPSAPTSSRRPAATSAGRAPAAGPMTEYVVKRGDTLSEIGRRFGVSVTALEEWNPALRRRPLYEGDRLKLHPASDRGQSFTYRVKRGDTLSGIAQRHGVRLEALAQWNDLQRPYRLRVGQPLVIFSGKSGPPRIVYTVKRGNSLGKIAEVFSVGYRDIMSWNELSTSRVRVGQKLIIRPSQAYSTRNYRVQRGDTVAKIARRFGVSVSHVLTANGLGRRTLIRPGQRLLVYVPG